ncbi:MAG TPA: ABC-F family ATP-binding cassette domain-containing protein [Anaerolineae bacterium]|nr:ABC-F family ATP-binding cassette domain-containing protein [Anaerolineae bacterium]
MSLIRLHNVSKSYDAAPVLREVFFRLEKGERVGLIGKNGSGKTTILKLILGQEEPTEGTVEVDAGVRIGYFSQFATLDGAQSVEDVLDALFADIHTLEAALDEVEGALGAAPDDDAMERLLQRQAELLDEMERREGWDYTRKIDVALTRLGFAAAHRTCPIEQLSGGWRNRAALAKLLLEAPDVLLLDEPTNYLDVTGLAWLEEWLAAFPGALLLVSHDRQFLDRVVTRIIEIENHHFQEYAGNYTQYVREKPLRLKSLERQFEHEEELLAFEAEAIADRREALKNPDQALKRKLANIKKQVAPRPVDTIITNIYQRLHAPSNLLRVERLAKAYGDQTLFHDLTFEVHSGDRIAIVGPNGCGKTTLLRVLVESEPPDAGRVVWASGVRYVYYNQVFADLDLNDTVTHAVNVVGLAYLAPRKQVNRFLSLMQFSEMDLTQRIGTLSGGQRARVALAQALLSGAPLILLDEPTNHLDMTTAQVMERALAHFPGAVIVVSHDRFFIDKVATRMLLFADKGQVREVSGNWTIWQASQQRGQG